MGGREGTKKEKMRGHKGCQNGKVGIRKDMEVNKEKQQKSRGAWRCETKGAGQARQEEKKRVGRGRPA